MTTPEILRLVNIFARLGIDKIRLTGGEPSIHPDLLEIVRGIRATGISRISMTTNGLRLADLAKPLKEAGLERVNVSVDTLDPDRFHRVTRWGKLDKVHGGHPRRRSLRPHAAQDQCRRRARLQRTRCGGSGAPHLDPSLAGALHRDDALWRRGHFAQDAVVSQAEIIQRIEAELGPLTPVDDGRLDGEARLYRLAGALAAIGFISTVTNPFCASCSRVRLTADGQLRLCSAAR